VAPRTIHPAQLAERRRFGASSETYRQIRAMGEWREIGPMLDTRCVQDVPSIGRWL
jgi:hypothetical protein